MSIEWVMPSNHLIFCPPLFSFCLQSSPASGSIPVSQLFALDDQSIGPFNEYSGLISFRIDWFDLLAVQWTLKSLHQHHNLKASILQHSAFFMVQQQPVLRFSGILTACIHLLTSGFGSLLHAHFTHAVYSEKKAPVWPKRPHLKNPGLILTQTQGFE